MKPSLSPETMCPVCGFRDLRESPRSAGGSPSMEICPSCGFQFGVSDDDEGFSIRTWREEWRAQGCPWSSRGRPRPAEWDPLRQLEAVEAPPKKGPLRPPPDRRTKKK